MNKDESRRTVMRWLRANVTEDATDDFIDFLLDQVDLPWYVPGFLVKRTLDGMFPELLLDGIEKALGGEKEDE